MSEDLAPAPSGADVASAVPTIAAGRWQLWATASSHRRVLAAGLTVGFFTAGVQACSLLKEMVVAGHFGAGDKLDAFFIAFLLPSFGINVLGSSLNSALLPAYVGARERDGVVAAHAMLAGVTGRTLALLAGLSVVLAVAFPALLPLMASSFSPAKLHLTTTLFYLLLPSLICSALAAVWSGVLNAHDAFGVAAMAPAVVPIAIIVAVLSLGAGADIHAVAAGVTAGALLQCAILARALVGHGVSLRPRWGAMTADIREVYRQYAPAMGGAILASSSPLIDQSMAAMLGSGSVATFNYGTKLVSAVLGVGMVAVGTAVLPQFSRLAANGEWLVLREAFRRYTLLMLLLLIPLTIAIIALSEPLVRLVFERGAFGPDDTRRVAFIQQLLALQLPFFLVGILVVRLISAVRRNDLLMWGAATNVTLNVVFNLLLMKRLGVAGIALSTTLVYVIAATGMGIVLWRHLGRLQRNAADA
ncbi:MAG: lipid II flippase MurJ [Gemmatimonadaceae bacterium]